MSAPAANARSEPAITIQPVSGSSAKVLIWPIKVSSNSEFKAFKASGRFNVNKATRPFFSNVTVVLMIMLQSYEITSYLNDE